MNAPPTSSPARKPEGVTFWLGGLARFALWMFQLAAIVAALCAFWVAVAFVVVWLGG
jgi:hypothetical protein